MAFCLRQFLTPQVWKQAQHGLKKPRKNARWDFHHLILVTLAMTWSLGQSTPEKFEMARGLVAICRPKRRRAGQTAQGYQKALCRLPMRPLLALAGALRGRLISLLGDDLLHGGFIPLGCDGSRLECCRNDELLARLGQAGKAACSPSLWVTAVVHLTTGVPWSWRLGKGNASERDHLRQLLPSLPELALIVADAGFDGYDLAVTLLNSGASFLIRMSSKSHLFVDELPDPDQFRQGWVKYWPGWARQAKRPPLKLRLIRVLSRRGKDPKRAVDVWLLTNVDARRMSITQAGSFYRLRWENEGLFRSYKRTLSKVRLVGRTVRSVHREAYGSLLACQLLLAQGAWALRGARDRTSAMVTPCSPRQAILAVRKELKAAMKTDRRESYRERLARCARERRQRTSPKQKRVWPQRTPHKPPKPPRLLTMNEKLKALESRLKAVA
jgi:hypothetical protein